MQIPSDLRYTEEHEWVRFEDGLAIIGITDYAQKELGDIVYIELPQVGDEVIAAEAFGTVEAVKTVAELYSPVSGTVEEVNEALTDAPELVNHDPYHEGWMIKVRYAEKPEELLTAKEYRSMIA